MSLQPSAFRRLVDSVRSRREFHVLGLYLGTAWLVYDVAELTAFILDLPDSLVRTTVWILVAGILLAVPIARWYALTVRDLESRGGEISDDVPGVPDVLEGLLVAVSRRVGRGTALWTGLGATALFVVAFGLLWHNWAAAHERPLEDPRVTLAIFPFQAGAGDEGLGESLADLLMVTLEGTPSFRIAEPGVLWRDLDGAAPDAPGALEEARSVGARYAVTGRVLRVAEAMDVTVRVWDVGSGEGHASYRVSVPEDSLSAAVDRMAIDLVAATWDRQALPAVPEIDQLATSDAGALKAYLEAVQLLRDGDAGAAEASIERALALDSTFALAHLERFHIRSRLLYENARPFVGLRPILMQADRHRDRLSPRNRMRLDVAMAMDDTDGRTAAFLYERLLAADSMDFRALLGLAQVYARDGWQFGKGPDDVRSAWERVLRHYPDAWQPRTGLVLLSAAMGWEEPFREHGQAVVSLEDRNVTVRGVGLAYRILTSPEAGLDSLFDHTARQDLPVALTAFRHLRNLDGDRAEALLRAFGEAGRPAGLQSLAQGAMAQIRLARGGLSDVESMRAAGSLDRVGEAIDRYYVTTYLAGVGDPALAARAVGDVRPEEALGRMGWATAWSIGAYRASVGDTVSARSWQAIIAALEQGDTWWDWPTSLASDLEARILLRRGDTAGAQAAAGRAYDLWAIHSANALGSEPEPAMRFHLAELARAVGEVERAAALYRSFTLPHTWMGFYTARASFELGRIEESLGRADEAARHFGTAVRMWRGGDEKIVGTWLGRAEEGLARNRVAGGGRGA